MGYKLTTLGGWQVRSAWHRWQSRAGAGNSISSLGSAAAGARVSLLCSLPAEEGVSCWPQGGPERARRNSPPLLRQFLGYIPRRVTHDQTCRRIDYHPPRPSLVLRCISLHDPHNSPVWSGWLLPWFFSRFREVESLA